MKVKEVVLVHGAVGGHELIETMIRYFTMIVKEVKKVREDK